jgi:hypothetical protein
MKNHTVLQTLQKQFAFEKDDAYFYELACNLQDLEVHKVSLSTHEVNSLYDDIEVQRRNIRNEYSRRVR